MIGMFLWVRLVIEELGDIYNDADLEASVQGLPKGLKQAYIVVTQYFIIFG